MLGPRNVLRVGDQVLFDATEHTVVALAGTSVRLVSPMGQVTVVLLAHLLASPGFGLLDGVAPQDLSGLGMVADLAPEVLQTAREWERHVIEVETGRPPGAGPMRRPGKVTTRRRAPCANAKPPKPPS